MALNGSQRFGAAFAPPSTFKWIQPQPRMLSPRSVRGDPGAPSPVCRPYPPVLASGAACHSRNGRSPVTHGLQPTRSGFSTVSISSSLLQRGLGPPAGLGARYPTVTTSSQRIANARIDRSRPGGRARAHLGQHQPAADAKRRRGAKITPIAAITVLAACGGITAGVYLGPVEVKVPVNWQIGANALPDSSAASRGDTTATAAAAISVGQQGVATEPGSTANATVTAADTKSPESAALGPAPPSSRDVEPAHRRSRAEGAAHSVALRLTTDEAGPRHKAKQKHHRHYYARHNRGYRSQFASEGPQGDTPPGWYWEPQY